MYNEHKQNGENFILHNLRILLGRGEEGVNMLLNSTISSRLSGQGNVEELAKTLQDIDRHTKIIPCRGRDITLFYKYNGDGVPEDKIGWYRMDADGVQRFDQDQPLKVGFIKKEMFPENLLTENETQSRMMLALSDGEKASFMLMSPLVFDTFAARVGVSGGTSAILNDKARAMHFASALYKEHSKDKLQLVVRQDDDGTSVVIAVMGSQYKAIPQQLLSDVITMIQKEGKLGKVELESWELDNSVTDVFITFPDLAEKMLDTYGYSNPLVPGMHMRASDNGSSSDLFEMSWKIEGHPGFCYPGGNQTLKFDHRGVEQDKIKSDIKDNLLLEIREFPELMGKLANANAADYEKLDLNTEAGRRKNLNEIKKIQEKINKKILKLCFRHKEERDQIAQSLADEINSEEPYTLYDIAIEYLTIADRCEGLEYQYQKDMISYGVAKVPYELAKLLDKKPESELVLA